MQLVSIKPIVAVLWMTAVFAMSIAGNGHAFSTWIALAGIAVVPPLIMMWRWNDPRQTMSESIHQARDDESDSRPTKAGRVQGPGARPVPGPLSRRRGADVEE